MPSGPVSSLPVIAGIAGSVACLIVGLRFLWKKHLIDDLPTSRTQGVFIGLTELKGTAESETPLTSYLAGTRCVQYSWKVEEHWSRTVHETYTDSKGHTQTRTRTESGWTKVAGDSQSIPFYLKDETGIIRIVPEGATINNVSTFDETCSPNDALYYGKGPEKQIANSTHKRRFTETALTLHTSIYVMGQARERQDIAAAEIAKAKDAEMFLISTRTEKQISSSYGWWSLLWIILGLVIATGTAALWSFVTNPYTVISLQTLAAGAEVFLGALLLGWVWTVYNSLVNLHHMVERGWSQVDVQIKRRFDLIPNLENSVKGYTGYEKGVQTLLAELRTQQKATPPGVAGPDFKGVAVTLAGVVERYPDLKANESFLKLQDMLIDTEQRIALARDYFNTVATFYNTRLGIIPDRFIAAIAKLHPQTLMGAADFERAAIEVKLAD
jgi:hypothetical protein